MNLRALPGLLVLCVVGTVQSSRLEARADDSPPPALEAEADAWMRKADGQTGAEAAASRAQGAAAYFDLFQKHCQAPLPKDDPQHAERCEKLADSAARAFQSAHLVARAIQARSALVAVGAAAHRDSPRARRAVYEIGEGFQTIAIYDKAAEYYERFAGVDTSHAAMDCKIATKEENVDKALASAVVLRLGLGQEAEATCAANAFKAAFGGTKPAQAASLQFSIAAHHADKGEWEKARAALVDAMGMFDKSAAPDVQAQAHATLARAYTRTKGGEKQASSELAKVRSVWSNPRAALERINASYPGEDEGQLLRRLARALTAVGEAYFAAAEERKEREVDPLQFPAYAGRATEDDIRAHMDTKVERWLQKKSSAIDEVTAEYNKVVDLRPEAPPRWVVASRSRVGLLWGSLVDEALAAPLPLSLRTDAKLRGIYYAALDDKIQRVKDRKARPAVVACLRDSVRLRHFDAHARGCEAWLSKNYRAEYHAIDELGPAPTVAGPGPDAKSPPLRFGAIPGP